MTGHYNFYYVCMYVCMYAMTSKIVPSVCEAYLADTLCDWWLCATLPSIFCTSLHFSYHNVLTGKTSCSSSCCSFFVLLLLLLLLLLCPPTHNDWWLVEMFNCDWERGTLKTRFRHQRKRRRDISGSNYRIMERSKFYAAASFRTWRRRRARRNAALAQLGYRTWWEASDLIQPRWYTASDNDVVADHPSAPLL